MNTVQTPHSLDISPNFSLGHTLVSKWGYWACVQGIELSDKKVACEEAAMTYLGLSVIISEISLGTVPVFFLRGLTARNSGRIRLTQASSPPKPSLQWCHSFPKPTKPPREAGSGLNVQGPPAPVTGYNL